MGFMVNRSQKMLTGVLDQLGILPEKLIIQSNVLARKKTPKNFPNNKNEMTFIFPILGFVFGKV